MLKGELNAGSSDVVLSLHERSFFRDKAPIHYQTQSNDLLSCYGKPVEHTNEIEYRSRLVARSSLIVDRGL